MINVIKIDCFGKILEQGIIVHGLYVSSNKSEPLVVFTLTNNNYILAIDNNQCMYITNNINLKDGKLNKVNGGYVYYEHHYNEGYKIKKIDNISIYYETDPSNRGKLKRIDNNNIYYYNLDHEGKIKTVGNVNIYYRSITENGAGKVKSFGNANAYYSLNGKINSYGNINIYYDLYNNLQSIGNYKF